MNILVCAPEYYPYGSGIANVAFNVVEQCKKQGIKCTICSPTGPDIKLGNVLLIKYLGLIGLLYYWLRVGIFFRDDRYDTVWLHNPNLFIKSNSFKHCLVTIHTTYYGEVKNNVGNTFCLRFYKKITAAIEHYCLTRMNSTILFTGVGEQVCNELENIGIKRNQILTIPNGVDSEHFFPKNKEVLRKKFGIPSDSKVILSVGRLTAQKQPFRLIEVFSLIEQHLDNVILIIAGKGELLESTTNLVKEKGLKNVRFFGYVTNNDLPDLYASADCYILTSKYEGAPLTLLEAMASGLPCIVSDIPNHMIVQDADCGIIVCFDEIQKAAHEIMNYLESEHSDHAKNSRKYIIENLTWNTISERYLKEFSKTIKLNSKNQIVP